MNIVHMNGSAASAVLCMCGDYDCIVISSTYPCYRKCISSGEKHFKFFFEVQYLHLRAVTQLKYSDLRIIIFIVSGSATIWFLLILMKIELFFFLHYIFVIFETRLLEDWSKYK